MSNEQSPPEPPGEGEAPAEPTLEPLHHKNRFISPHEAPIPRHGRTAAPLASAAGAHVAHSSGDRFPPLSQRHDVGRRHRSGPQNHSPRYRLHARPIGAAD